MSNSVGFEFDDFVKVRDVIGDVYIEKLSDVRDQFHAVMHDSDKHENQDPAVANLGLTAFEDMFVRPGRRASFTAAEIAEKAGVPSAQARCVHARRRAR